MLLKMVISHLIVGCVNTQELARQNRNRCFRDMVPAVDDFKTLIKIWQMIPPHEAYVVLSIQNTYYIQRTIAERWREYKIDIRPCG